MTDLELTERVAKWCGIEEDVGWWCPRCEKKVDGRDVTYTEHHEVCGYKVSFIRFDPLHDWDDLMTKVVPKLKGIEIAIINNTYGIYQENGHCGGSLSDLPRTVCELVASLEKEGVI